MKCLVSLITELCLNPCCKLGNAAFWERLLFGRCPAEVDGECQPFRSVQPFLTQLFGPSRSVELIEIRPRASRKSKSDARIAVFAVKTSESFSRVEDAPKTDHSIE